MRRWCRLGQSTHLMDCFKGNKKSGHPHISWEFQDPKMEVLYHIRPYFLGIFSYMPYIGLTYGRHLQFRFLKFPLTIFHWTIPSVFRFSRKIPSIFLHIFQENPIDFSAQEIRDMMIFEETEKTSNFFAMKEKDLQASRTSPIVSTRWCAFCNRNHHSRLLPSGKLTVCYWKWPFIVDLPIKNSDFP